MCSSIYTFGDVVGREMNSIFEVIEETGKVFHLEAMFCAVPYLDMSQLLRLCVIGSFLSGESSVRSSFDVAFEPCGWMCMCSRAARLELRRVLLPSDYHAS